MAMSSGVSIQKTRKLTRISATLLYGDDQGKVHSVRSFTEFQPVEPVFFGLACKLFSRLAEVSQNGITGMIGASRLPPRPFIEPVTLCRARLAEAAVLYGDANPVRASVPEFQEAERIGGFHGRHGVLSYTLSERKRGVRPARVSGVRPVALSAPVRASIVPYSSAV
jgi:hypothetical protein